ncbi:hypothetical protein HWN39_10680 [Lactobacillus rhamnosus]|uniref:DUF1056 family protein n=1 Tax=Lacticaseibacillus rhamnosus TaxID=47715 RepID=A0A7Y7UK44_LACRH|nr:hypothetical protein [Lacticaseibacillus rhamnosus]NVO88943.1 hypothetical protein [Lacticaseibacillus rhamnosus]
MRLVEQFKKTLKYIGSFVLGNLETILFLCGLGFLIWSAYSASQTLGELVTAASLIWTAWIITGVKGGDK